LNKKTIALLRVKTINKIMDLIFSVITGRGITLRKIYGRKKSAIVMQSNQSPIICSLTPKSGKDSPLQNRRSIL
jgi:hypothetical protein